MSRWFRHYAGLCRDDKLVSAAIKAKQPVERVVWIWAAILESAAEIDDDGRYSLDLAEVAYFLRADESDIRAAFDALECNALISGNRVAQWRKYEFRHCRSLPADWSGRRQQVFERDGFACVYCGDLRGPFQCDHVVPVSRGGGHEVGNLATACVRCNQSKGAKPVSEWVQ